MRWLHVAIGTVVLLASCKQSHMDPLAIDRSYFPLSTGRYWIYDVDSIGYWGFADSVIISSYQIREDIDSFFIDETGGQTYRIVRSFRRSEADPWIATDVWSANYTASTAEKVEENLRFIKQVYPIAEGRKWYGNAYIQTDSPLVYLSDWLYRYRDVHRPFSLDGLQFDSTITVIQKDLQNIIEQIYYEEKYARGVGLIRKIEKNISTQPGKPWDGFEITYRLRAYQ
ncbi:MAG: hypothetical protein NZL95_02390 [Chitinophagales bacterium]|nr:hypothetical protein [Chitinophagales bacterium]MDW8427382.1 hypothetical protein [Chitinophagales bacterium]